MHSMRDDRISRLALYRALRRLSIGLFVAVCAGCGAGEPGTAPEPANRIVVENEKPGTPRSEWGVPPRDHPGIAGFATEMSVRPGDPVRLKVRSPTSYAIDIYRVGYYRGDGARKVASVAPARLGPQPPCRLEAEFGLLDCSGWFESAVWNVPVDAVSGVYFARLSRHVGAKEKSNLILFVVRESEPASELLVQTSDITWQAYNRWGDVPGHRYSLYRGPDGSNQTKAVKVSYDRPLGIGAHKTRRTQHFLDGRHGFFAAEYPLVRFLERNGYDVSYQSGGDTARDGASLLEHGVFISVAHDEYWSAAQRENVERARDAGVHLAFVSGNSIFYKIRWEEDHRTIVCYKRPTPPDHELANIWTARWTDPNSRAVDPSVLPENALKGTTGASNSDMALQVPAELGRLRFWRETEFANLPDGAVGVSVDNTVGYEWETDIDNGLRPPGLMRLSQTQSREEDAPGAHQMTLHRHAASNALVFSAASVQLSWGLDGPDPAHRFARTGRADVPADRNIQQAMVNLFADMGVRAATLQSDLIQTTASEDRAPPTAAFAQPEHTATTSRLLLLEGSARDEDGGVVAGVEVNVLGTWHRADGLEHWSYRYTPSEPGRQQLRVRAVDDSGNLGPESSAEVIVGPR
jgi:hypothetical protein